MTPFDYVEPATLDEALACLAEHGDDAHPVAGATSVVLMLRQQLLQPKLLVGLRGIEELRGIWSDADDGLEIGATTTHREIERSEQARRYAPVLADAFGSIATVRIRNQGTIGGNLAHADPAQDPPPVLLALDAEVAVSSPGGERTIPLTELFVDYFETSLEPGELISAIRLPTRSPDAVSAYAKFLPRTKDDYATVAVAASARRLADGTLREVRIALGAVGPIPMRVPAAESVLEREEPVRPAIDEAAHLVAQAVEPLDDLRGSAAYKREMARVWTARVLRTLSAAAPADGGGDDAPRRR
jgi:aerobic carbon-monoxide dehydrogenase medium subunit